MNLKDVIAILEEQSPKSFACDWDNVGLLTGREDKEVKKIYIALDASDPTDSKRRCLLRNAYKF